MKMRGYVTHSIIGQYGPTTTSSFLSPVAGWIDSESTTMFPTLPAESLEQKQEDITEQEQSGVSLLSSQHSQHSCVGVAEGGGGASNWC